jgi:outer membrane protein assembly factor BamB
MKTLSALLLALCATTMSAADWPQFLGPKRDGHSAETGLLKTWPKAGPMLAWTFKDAGVGYSSPAVVGERVYLSGARGADEYLFALNAATGKEEWKLKIGPVFSTRLTDQWGKGPRSTACVADGKVYAMGGWGDLVCAEAKSGELVWKTSMAKDLKGEVNPICADPTKTIGWGFTWSPLVDGDKLIVYPGGPDGAVAALDCKTGKPLWQSKKLTVQASYASPVMAELAGVKQYVVFSNEGLHGISTDGDLLWSYKRINNDVVMSTPICHDDHVYCSIGMGKLGCDLVKISKAGGKFTAKKVYSNKEMKNRSGGVVLVGDALYGYSDTIGWVCQDFKTGEAVWDDKKLGPGSLICGDGNLYCYDEEEGVVALVEATRAKYTEKSRFTLPDQTKLRSPSGKNWTPPVIANGHLFIRDQELLFCYKIK